MSLIDGTTIDHVYDMDGNRVQTKVTPPGGTATVTNYLVDTTGNLSQVVAESDGTGALTAVYVRAYDELLAVIRRTSATTWATRYVHSDGLGSVRVLTDESGNVTDTRDYEAFGVRNESTGSDALAFGFAGEPFENLSKLAYHRARWMDPRSGRFLSSDSWRGDNESPGTLQRYAYVVNNPTNLIDPTGLSASIFMDWGKEVHEKLSEHFENACLPGCARTNLSIGRILGGGGASVRPDLVDVCDRYVYEIKTVLEFISGIVQVEGYVDTMNKLDPSAKLNPWKIGGPYVPPSVVALRDGSFAIVSPPDYGVISYQVIDMRTILLAAAGAIAANQYSNMTAGMSGALAMASLGVVY